MDKATLLLVLRWIHVVAGVLWIGLLYFLNLVNVPFQKELEAEVKPKVNPKLMPRTLYWFRHAAMVTFVSGLIYFIHLASPKAALIKWAVVVGVAYAIIYALLQPAKGALNNGKLLAVIIGAVSLVLAVAGVAWIDPRVASPNTLFIAIGGGFGTIMFLNVWVIIWPNQKKVLGLVQATAEEKPLCARRAFLASRTNAWLSLPMLFFMTANHSPTLFSGLTM